METVPLHDGGRLHVSPAERSEAVLVLGHGAGGGVDVTDLEWLAADLPERGITVVRHEQPWRARGAKVAPPPPRLDEGWVTAMVAVAERWPDRAVITGGRSAGARVACRGAVTVPVPPVAAVVTLAFPLHPPGRPDRSRVAELVGVPVPVLMVAGERDPFGTPDEVRAAVGDAWLARNSLVVVPGAGHALVPSAKTLSRADVRTLLTRAVGDFALRMAAGNS